MTNLFEVGSSTQTELSSRPERTRISYLAAPPKATFAAFRKESRMKFANATDLDRKSGEEAQTNLETKEGWRARWN